MRARQTKQGRNTARPALSARLSDGIALESDADGNVAACFDGFQEHLGTFSPAAVKRAEALRNGLPLTSFARTDRAIDKEVDQLVRQLAVRGLLEYRLGPAQGGDDQVVIEPQGRDYWPRTPKLGPSETIVLSRFAYLRRRGNEMVLESPRATALFKLCDARIAAVIATLSVPQQVGQLRRAKDFLGIELLALLLDCNILFKLKHKGSDGRRAHEGDHNLVLWDFHDLLFHTHSTEGRQANPLGGLYAYADLIAPPPPVRMRWPGKSINLDQFSAETGGAVSSYLALVRARQSTRDFDDAQPITLAELARFLDCTARVQSKWSTKLDIEGGGRDIDYTSRPYPAGGSAYELELYLAVSNCEGLARGFYHYDADRHALVPIAARAQELEASIGAAQFAMDAIAPPQILITIAARFNRVSWKYSAIAYSLILKDVGVLIEVLYMMATDMGLGGCAIGTSNLDLFAKLTGIDFHVEGPVGQFALGRGKSA